MEKEIETPQDSNNYKEIDPYDQSIHTVELRGIYFLFKSKQIVYIGKSENIHNRAYNHIRTKNFDNYSFIEIKDKNINIGELELFYIKKYKPFYNITGLMQELQLSIDTKTNSELTDKEKAYKKHRTSIIEEKIKNKQEIEERMKWFTEEITK